jgi:hypothetical protein
MHTHGNNPNDPHHLPPESLAAASPDSPEFAEWREEERWWREHYAERPYVERGRDFVYYRPAYQYGFESARRHRDRRWNDMEADLRSGWDQYEHRGNSTWNDIKESVRDAWERVAGREHKSRS